MPRAVDTVSHHCYFPSMRWLAPLILPGSLLLAGCATLTKEANSSADLRGNARLEGVCGSAPSQNHFFLNTGRDRILVLLQQSDDVTWIGPLVLPLLPIPGGTVTIRILSNRAGAEAKKFAAWSLEVHGEKHGAEKIEAEAEDASGTLARLEAAYGFRSGTTLHFSGAYLRGEDGFTLDTAQENLRIPFRTTHRWFYLPLFGPMMDRAQVYCVTK